MCLKCAIVHMKSILRDILCKQNRRIPGAQAWTLEFSVAICMLQVSLKKLVLCTECWCKVWFLVVYRYSKILEILQFIILKNCAILPTWPTAVANSWAVGGLNTQKLLLRFCSRILARKLRILCIASFLNSNYLFYAASWPTCKVLGFILYTVSQCHAVMMIKSDSCHVVQSIVPSRLSALPAMGSIICYYCELVCLVWKQ